MIAYHFLCENMRSYHGDEPPWRIGEERSIDGELRLGRRGYHSSPTPWGALVCANGPVLCQVEVSEPVESGAWQQVSRSRRLLRAVNVEWHARSFACDLADEALTLVREHGGEVDPRSARAIEVLRRFVAGEAHLGEWAQAYLDALDALAATPHGSRVAMAAAHIAACSTRYEGGDTAWRSCVTHAVDELVEVHLAISRRLASQEPIPEELVVGLRREYADRWNAFAQHLLEQAEP